MERLKEIEKSLAPPAEPARKSPEKKDTATDLTQALLKLPEIASKLESLLKEQQAASDALVAIQDLEFSLRQLAVKVDDHLTELRNLSVNVDRRVKALDLAEAKYQRLLENVDRILPELEKELNR